MKRVALIVPGGFGTGKNNLGIPVLEQIAKKLSTQFEISVFQLYRVSADYQVEGFELFGFQREFRLFQYLKFFIALRREHKKKKFYAVHGFWAWPCGFCAVAFGKIFNVRSVVSVLGGDGSSVPEIDYGYLHRSFYRKVILWSLRQAEEATALTSFLADNLKRAGLTRDLKIIPWGVDSDLFSFRERQLDRPVRFLHIGNFNKVKDQTTLLKTFALLKKKMGCHLTLISEGSEESTILKLINELGVQSHVTILHHMPHSKLPAHYHFSDILLHTSLSEGQGEVIAEAMSCGAVVCGTNVGLLYDLPDCCVSVPVRDHVTLAQKIVSLVSDQTQLDSIRHRAKKWTDTHDLNWTVKELAKLYN